MVLCGLKREACVGTWCGVISGPTLSVGSTSLLLPHSPHKGREKEMRGPVLSTLIMSEGDFTLCVSSGPLVLLQESSAVFQGRPCLKRMKEFGQTEESLNLCLKMWECFKPAMLCLSAQFLIRLVSVCVCVCVCGGCAHLRAHTQRQTKWLSFHL